MLFIRADSNNIISGGHIMRCLTIAKAVQKMGGDVCFLIADDNSSQVLAEAGVQFSILHSDWQDLMSDVDMVKLLLQEEHNPVLLIDTYRITKKYVDELKPFCKIGYLGSKKEYFGQLDFLINYGTDIDYKFYNDNYDEKTNLLLGPDYAPLREEFQNVNHSYKNRIERMLLTTGNTDRDHMVNIILESVLPQILESDIVMDVVIGRMFNNKEKLFELYGKDRHIKLHENVKSMSVLMKDCDLAISANGTTIYELSAMGVPTISFAMVKEQVRSAEALFGLGVIDYCGSSYQNKDDCVKAIVKRMKYYFTHNHELTELAKKAHNLIDGNGCQKIIETLCNGVAPMCSIL